MDVTQNWFEYLHTKRKLSPRVIQEAGLFVHDGWLGIPIKDETGETIFNKYRRAPWMDESLPKYRYEKGATAHLYGAEKVNEANDITIVEGELDCLALATCGYVAVSTTGGSQTFREEWKDIIAPANVTVMYDNDIAGLKGSVKVAFMLRSCTFRWIPPMYGKDISDVLMNYGEETVHKIMTGTDNTLKIDIPELVKEIDVRDFRRTIGDTLKSMSTGSVGSMFLREMVVQLSCMISELGKAKRKTPQDTTRLALAKAYPIENLIKVTRHKAKCPFHEERTESFHVYPNNTFFCFGCSKYGDVLTLYAHLHGLDVRNKTHFRTIIDALAK